jgi:tetratricopeptide (TPR) repeat protein
MMIGSVSDATLSFRKAVTDADELLASPGLDQAERSRVTGIRLTLLNDVGWALLSSRQFSEALASLREAHDGRETQRAGRASCDKAHREDVELATVNQNLADVTLALGRFKEASDYARQARQCRTELGAGLEWKVLESTKTQGYALIYSGEENAGKELLQAYSDAIRRMLDDDKLPLGDPFISGAIVDGRFVPLEQFVHLPDKYGTTRLPMPPPVPRGGTMEDKSE